MQYRHYNSTKYLTEAKKERLINWYYRVIRKAVKYFKKYYTGLFINPWHILKIRNK